MGNHGDQTTLKGLHPVTRFEFPDVVSRLVADFTFPAVKPPTHSGTLQSSDVGSIALQQDTTTFWILQDHSPITWLQIGVASQALNTLVLHVLKGSAGTIVKGQAVYPSGWDVLGSVSEVELSRSDSSSTMPALGIASSTITNSVEGFVTILGEVSGIDTSSWSQGDSLYVDSGTAGDLTNVKPVGAAHLIQKVGIAQYSHATEGVILVVGAGRSNDVPNLTQGYAWVGDANNHASEVLAPGSHWRGNSATNPSSPVQGDSYYNTVLDMVMNYDDTRAKWLSEEMATFYGSRKKATATGSYFRLPDKVTMSPAKGFYMPRAGTVVAIGVSRSNVDIATVEVTADGTAVAEVSLGASTEAGSVALNGDFALGDRMAIRNKTGLNDVDDGVIWFGVRWRV